MARNGLGKYAEEAAGDVGIKSCVCKTRLMVVNDGVCCLSNLRNSRRIARAPIKPTFCLTNRRRVWIINRTIWGEQALGAC